MGVVAGGEAETEGSGFDSTSMGGGRKGCYSR